MKKVPLYSRSRRIAEPEPATATAASGATASAAAAAPVAAAPTTRRGRWKAGALRHERRLWALAVVLLLVGAVLLNPRLAPLKAAVFPLVNKDGMPEIAQELYLRLKKDFNVFYDDKGAVGRRYRRQDEAGTHTASPSTARRSRIRPSPCATATP